jgi:hypothetical protein
MVKTVDELLMVRSRCAGRTSQTSTLPLPSPEATRRPSAENVRSLTVSNSPFMITADLSLGCTPHGRSLATAAPTLTTLR